MRFFTPAIIIFYLFSCKQPLPVVSEVESADSVAINIKPATDTTMLNFNTKDKNAVKKLANYLNGKTTGEKSCADDGDFSFYKGGVLLQTVTFNFRSKDCRHFFYTYKGEQMNLELNNEAVDFFTALEKGKSTY